MKGNVGMPRHEKESKQEETQSSVNRNPIPTQQRRDGYFNHIYDHSIDCA